MPFNEIDALVHRINAEVSAQIDCTQCANCCKDIVISLDEADITNFSSGLNIPEEQFIAQYLVKDDHDSHRMRFTEVPCPFLENNLCANYDHRPEACRSYPHLHKKDFIHRLMGVIGNYEECPIVFNVYEQLKIELWQ